MRWEKYNSRCSAFSQWHRKSLPDYCAAIDVDWIEVCYKCYTPLALFELARDVGQNNKSSTSTRKLAELSDLKAYVLLYSIDGDGELSKIRLKRVAPTKKPADGSFAVKTPEWIAKFIIKIHRDWACPECRSSSLSA